MKSNKTIVTFFHNPWNYHCDFEIQTINHLSKKYSVIIFNEHNSTSLFRILFSKKERLKMINLVKCKNKRIIKFIPINIIPFSKLLFFKNLNKFLSLLVFKFFLNIKGIKKPIFWLFSFRDYRFTKYFKNKFIIYDCVDMIDNNNLKPENDFVKKSDIVFVNSEYLLRKNKKININTHLVPCGCRFNHFRKNKFSVPEDLIKIPKPIVGIAGGIDWRTNLSLVERIAKNNVNVNFVFIGPLIVFDKSFANKFKAVVNLKNVYYLGNKSKSSLRNYYNNFNICLIPYNFNKKAHGNNPMRLYEYFALGKPVISSPVEALNKFKPYLFMASSIKEFESSLKGYLQKVDKKSYISKRIIIAKQNSWDNKVKIMCQLLDNNKKIKYL